ncbi:tRNA 5-hydroxyuridine modification protein YegQ [Spongiibacter sp. KMU-158]|uniref:tRNA 5-hydroxyuridine modification protein YegQ n=1 Tax=Spongiibacter pelagi TaxID=2760804 RepID=A0A927BY09_9GAMM|nr:tRNA 5-hydroxyuridine modification protein YegQ [Spongiibacter pelagi]MBD2857638.1 tRNA 5-hydroxyuridine modification protein YegQ [Spongiibacter pelagi]
MSKPELLSPAGSLRNMRYAFAYGADAVYAGQPRYSLRVRNNEFKDLETLATGIEEAHAQGKQFYLASNIQAHNDKIRSYLRDLEPVIELGPDALIMSDPGLIMLVRERWPDQAIHLSVQANAVNWAAVKFWHQAGLQRVILSRELSIEEIEEIRQQVPEMELEVFVHGALCIAYSGRCLLSGYMNHRDSNQGACTNACRWEYQAHEAKEDASGDLIPVQEFVPEPAKAPQAEPVLLQQAQRPGEYMPAYEDEHGTYIMNSKDLRAVQHVERLTQMGIHSLKIEGRTKSHYYVARTAQVYRRAIDDAVAGRPFDMGLMDELETLANRGYTEGFYRRHPPKEYQNYEQGLNTAQRQQFVAEVIDAKQDEITVEVKNRFALGDTLQLMTPQGNLSFPVSAMMDRKGKHANEAPGSGHQRRIPLPENIDVDTLKYGLLVKNL